MSYSTTRPTAAQPYDRQRRPALLGRDTSVEAGGPSTWAGALNPTTPAYSWPPAVTPNPINPATPEQATPPQGPTDVLSAMREMMESMEARMEARIQQALIQQSRPPSMASRASRALPRLPREAPFPPPPPGPPTPPPPPAPLVELPPVPQARNYGPKMARPEVFDGERAKCRGFIRNIEVYIFVNAYQFPNEATKVLYLLSYVQGKKVDNWKNTMTTKVLEWTRTHIHDEQVSSFRRICRSLQEAFGDPNPRDTAVTALTHLHQRSDTAEDYVMKFNAHKDDTGYNDVALVELFKRGLNAGLLTRIYGRRPLPTNCEEWQDEAIALDRQWREAQAYAKTAPAKPAARTTTTTAPQNQWRPDDFKGTILHTVDFRGGEPFKDKKVIVVGAGNSAADICQDLVHHGAASVTMVQRSSTCVMTAESIHAVVDAKWPNGVPTDISDFKSESLPFGLLRKLLSCNEQKTRDDHKAMHEGLTKAGLTLNMGIDGAGFFSLLHERLGGYWMDIGCAQLIIDGKVKIKQGVKIARTSSNSVHFTDGSTLVADDIVFATGYENIQDTMRPLFGDETIDKTGPVYGKDEEGEFRVSYRPSGHPGLWFATGDFIYSRFYSKRFALELKAIQLGII
ncbi:hypothetical protein CCMSSC00406_0009219 [Pleurotus cornucopiae]|uniref:Uncharacterized protein n=1 Tax=Pleurotus cornucopiae TaxID=5321 RepID=A0ACB7J205_PLECO|nr:hypothetical protein CCMSSC00406_0009219 [Pleurotus cornucopiae]